MEFRAVLIKLFNQLSDIDRQALHFSIGNIIPRKYREDCTPSGSLHLLDSLFDQNLINEKNFDFLINIFEQINCSNISTQLKEYKLNVTSTPFNEAIFIVEHDKMKSFSNDVQTTFSTESSIELEDSINTHTTIRNKRKQLFLTIQKIFNTKRDLFLIILFIIAILSLLICFTVLGIFLIRSSKVNHPLFHSLVKQERFYVIKEGLQYGNKNNESFNDANDLGLSYTDRCIGVKLQWTNTSLISIRFLYSNDRSSNISTNKTKDKFIVSSTFMLTSNEEINKINLYQNLYEINSSIVGIQFRTTNGRKSDVFGSNDGHFLTESFEYYTFNYAKGIQQIDKGIEMLQFVWIKHMLEKEYINTEPRLMIEVCQFSFFSSQDGQFILTKGIESSWYDLKRKFNRQGSECNSTASYYEKTSQRGPELFAIVGKTSVFYHHDDAWHKYRSADNINCNILPLSDPSSHQES